MALRTVDRRVHETVVLPRFRMEEQLVDIQAAAGETSKWIGRAARCYDEGRLPEGQKALGAADTLARLIELDAHRLAGEVSNTPDYDPAA
jgi:hypothetical protein